MNQKLLRKWWLLCIGLGILLAQPTLAQDRQVSGKVSAEDGSPIPGANVRIKGTTKGTTTDAAGQFKVSVSDASVLQISSVGFNQQEVKVGSQTSISVTLNEDISALDEVVVTGYQTDRKSVV